MAVKKMNRSIEAFIKKGADVKSNKEKSFKNVLVRIPTSIIDQMDSLIEKKPWITRTQLIVEAIHNKIKSDEDEEEENLAG